MSRKADEVLAVWDRCGDAGAPLPPPAVATGYSPGMDGGVIVYTHQGKVVIPVADFYRLRMMMAIAESGDADG